MTSPEHERRLGKYIVGGELGRGGFATVYRAQDTVLRRDVALKVLHPALLTDPAFVTRFENDARATAQLDHPRIATIYELGHHDGRMFMAVQLLVGGSLADRIKEGGRLLFAEAVRVVEDIAQALDYAHAAGFTHRDVKPSNMLFNRRGDAILTDFGLVKAAESSVIARTTIGGLIGTPAYMAPEIWEGHNDGPGADIYALGCVLFEMLNGELLFTGATPPAVMLAHFRPHRYPERWPDGTPAGVEAVLERALAREPAARYPSAGALAAELRALAGPPAAPDGQLVQVQPHDAVVAPSPGLPDLAQPLAGLGPGASEAEAAYQLLDNATPVEAIPQAQPNGGMVQAADPQSSEAVPERVSQAGQRAARPITIVSIAWIGGWLAAIALGWILEGNQSSANAGLLVGWAAGWAGAGLLAGWGVRQRAPAARGWHTLWLVLGWPLCMTIALILGALTYGSQPTGALAELALGAAFAGAAAGVALRGYGHNFTVGQLVVLAICWAGGWRLAEIINNDGSGGGPWNGVLYKLSVGENFHAVFATYSQLKPIYLGYGGVLGAALGMGLLWLFGRRAASR